MNWRSMTILRTDVHREVHGDNFEDSNSRSKDEAFELNGYLFWPATPRARHVLFWHYVTSGRRQARLPIARCMRQQEHFSDRKLMKATDANYARHRESSVKAMSRRNFKPGTHLAYSAPGKQRASRCA